MMKAEGVFSILSKCFAPTSDGEWAEITEASTWTDFLESARCMLQTDRGLADDARHNLVAPKSRPLADFLSDRELAALLDPPTAEAKRAFERRHFTGGLPESALPIESLYRDDRSRLTRDPFDAAIGSYLGPTARYMRGLVESLGMSVPAQFADCPDHLALELDLVAVLLRTGMVTEVKAFAAERFAWLSIYRLRLIPLGEDALFPLALVDIVCGIASGLEPAEPDGKPCVGEPA